ncbi:Rv3654c family TadE-like protein [Microbacterium elymi]|uniref:Helicase n=1 Tax=Microbacterium elymi TaxID=2909587 RepID=A0ABY5NIH5_9MICO|nr:MULTISPECIES: Rv3654c family TadE-like protein [Microbacterium]UUT34984.1 helicase [Microbacterium elymi]
MAGTVLAVGTMGVAAVLTVSLGAVGAAAVQAQRAAGAADAAALAAADAASGAATGIPCDRAAQLAEADGAALTACEVDGLVATVSVHLGFGALWATASARAGPPAVSAPG